MASNRYAPEGTYGPYRDDDESGTYGVVHDSYRAHHEYGSQEYGNQEYGSYGQYDAYGSLLTETYEQPLVTEPGPGFGPESGFEFVSEPGHRPGFAFAPEENFEPPREEWNPTEESVRPVRGRHKVAKQRGGSMARSSAVLGVGMIAAVGAGGMATAQERPAAISMPDVSAATDTAKDLPGVGTLLAGGDSDEVVAGQPLTQAALTADDAKAGRTDAGEALRSRILQQAQQAQSQADASAREAAAKKAADVAEAKAAKEVAADRKAEAEKKAKAEKARLAKLAKSFALPVSGSQLTSSFGESGSLWTNNHTGQDFAASSGTPIKAVGSGTVKEAGWAGSYGYRTILELNDGTELWFSHQSSMNVSAGEKVSTGEVIGRVGATGNVTGAHLHLEVRPGGGDPIDPLAWMRGKGLSI